MIVPQTRRRRGRRRRRRNIRVYVWQSVALCRTRTHSQATVGSVQAAAVIHKRPWPACWSHPWTSTSSCRRSARRRPSSASPRDFQSAPECCWTMSVVDVNKCKMSQWDCKLQPAITNGRWKWYGRVKIKRQKCHTRRAKRLSLNNKNSIAQPKSTKRNRHAVNTLLWQQKLFVKRSDTGNLLQRVKLADDDDTTLV